MAGIIAHDAPVRASDVQAQPRAQRNRQFHQLSRRIANISGQGQRLGYSDACQLAAMPGLFTSWPFCFEDKKNYSQARCFSACARDDGDDGGWRRQRCRRRREKVGEDEEGERRDTHTDAQVSLPLRRHGVRSRRALRPVPPEPTLLHAIHGQDSRRCRAHPLRRRPRLGTTTISARRWRCRATRSPWERIMRTRARRRSARRRRSEG